MALTLSVPAEISSLTVVRRFVTQVAQDSCGDEGFIYDLVLAVDEAVTNVIVHGYSQEQGVVSGKIQLTVEPVTGGLAITIQDDAPWFDPTLHSAPDFSQPLELRPRGGMCIHLVRQLTEDLKYEAVPSGGNILRMVKHFPIS